MTSQIKTIRDAMASTIAQANALEELARMWCTPADYTGIAAGNDIRDAVAIDRVLGRLTKKVSSQFELIEKLNPEAKRADEASARAGVYNEALQQIAKRCDGRIGEEICKAATDSVDDVLAKLAAAEARVAELEAAAKPKPWAPDDSPIGLARKWLALVDEGDFGCERMAMRVRDALNRDLIPAPETLVTVVTGMRELRGRAEKAEARVAELETKPCLPHQWEQTGGHADKDEVATYERCTRCREERTTVDPRVSREPVTELTVPALVASTPPLQAELKRIRLGVEELENVMEPARLRVSPVAWAHLTFIKGNLAHLLRETSDAPAPVPSPAPIDPRIVRVLKALQGWCACVTLNGTDELMAAINELEARGR